MKDNTKNIINACYYKVVVAIIFSDDMFFRLGALHILRDAFFDDNSIILHQNVQGGKPKIAIYEYIPSLIGKRFVSGKFNFFCIKKICTNFVKKGNYKSFLYQEILVKELCGIFKKRNDIISKVKVIGELTYYEKSVLRHLSYEMSNFEISQVLCISIKKVSRYKCSAMRKLGFYRNNELYRWLYQGGLEDA